MKKEITQKIIGPVAAKNFDLPGSDHGIWWVVNINLEGIAHLFPFYPDKFNYLEIIQAAKSKGFEIQILNNPEDGSPISGFVILPAARF